MLFLKKIIIKIFTISILILIVATLAGLILVNRYPLDYKEYIYQYSNENSIDPFLVASIINVESRYRKEAISPKDARGLMQIAEQTGQWASEELKLKDYTKESLFDPKTNIKIGTWYLNKLEKEFSSNQDLILAAYNGGSGNVNKWLKDKEYSKDGESLDKIPFKETENYLKKVKNNYKIYKKIYKDIDFKNEEFDSLYIKLIYKIKEYINI